MGLTQTGEVPDEPFKHYKTLCGALFANIIKPEKTEKFYNEYSNWFVLEQTNEMKRKPGRCVL